MNDQLLSIGEIAKIKDISKKTLRFYDRIGLLKPYYIDETNSYRYYHVEQFFKIDIIKAARKLGISPKLLIPLFENNDTLELMKLLDHHKKETIDKIKKLEDVISGLDAIHDNLIKASELEDKDAVYIKELPERYCIAIDYNSNATLQDILQDMYSLDVLADNLKAIPTYEAGVIYRMVEDTSYPQKFFTTIAKPIGSDKFHRILEGTFACITFTKENVLERQRILYQYIRQQKKVATEVLQIEFLSDVFNCEKSIWEFQVRIT